MREAMGDQARGAAATERCADALAAWRKLGRKGRRGETETQRATRLEAVEKDEKWIANALALSLRELGYRPRNTAPLLAEVGRRANGSAVVLAQRLLGLTEDALRAASKKKRQPRSTALAIDGMAFATHTQSRPSADRTAPFTFETSDALELAAPGALTLSNASGFAAIAYGILRVIPA